jgi:tyrosinase
MLNSPPSPNGTLDDPIELGYAGGDNITIRDAMSTVKGPFCYIYL